MPVLYRIRVANYLDEDWSGWFDGMAISHLERSHETILIGMVRDQAQLYGLLAKMRDLNLTLLGLDCQPPGQTGDGPASNG